MRKLTVNEAAKLYGVTKEAIYNRVRRGKLSTVVEEGLKYVVVPDDIRTVAKNRPKTYENKMDKYLIYLEKQIEELKRRVQKLETENEKLIKEKMAILKESNRKLEEIFFQRDEQFKRFFALIEQKRALPKIESVEVIDTNVKKKDKKRVKKKDKSKKKKRKKK